MAFPIPYRAAIIRPHHGRTWTVQSYKTGGASVQPQARRVHPSRHASQHSIRTGAAACRIALSIGLSTAGHVWACPGPTHFRPQSCPFTHEDVDPI